MASTFLTRDDVATLTGCKLKGKQIEALRKMHLPFFVNARGIPVVPTSAVSGGGTTSQPKKGGWAPPV
jgi:hypothetical protein